MTNVDRKIASSETMSVRVGQRAVLEDGIQR
jgi:hypothetical protein